MSNRLDDVARVLATPMPRGRALRLAVGALAAVALPGVGARVARAGITRGAGTCPPGGQLTCAEQFGKDVSECCSRPIPGSGNYTCCPPGQCFYSETTNTCCPKDFQCGKGGCCSEGERCVNEKCVRCDSDKVCGKECCEESETCVNPAKSMCCVKTWNHCKVAGAAGAAGAVVKCCPPRDECCTNRRTKTVTCCDSKHPCEDGRCKCGKDETRCGDAKCCKKDTEVCSRGKCCPKGRENCGDGRCCEKGKCCGKDCCGKGEFCAASIAFSKPKVCCTSNRIIVTASGKPVCCPKGTLPNAADTGCCPPGDPSCCGRGDDELSCLGGLMCVRGVCQKIS